MLSDEMSGGYCSSSMRDRGELKGESERERDFREEEKRRREGGRGGVWNPRPAPSFISGVPVI